MSRRHQTIKIEWAPSGKAVIVSSIFDNEPETRRGVLHLDHKDPLYVLLDCCGEPHTLEPITTAARQGGNT